MNIGLGYLLIFSILAVLSTILVNLLLVLDFNNRDEQTKTNQVNNFENKKINAEPLNAQTERIFFDSANLAPKRYDYPVIQLVQSIEFLNSNEIIQ